MAKNFIFEEKIVTRREFGVGLAAPQAGVTVGLSNKEL